MNEKKFVCDTSINLLIYSFFYKKNVFRNIDYNNCYFEACTRYSKEFNEVFIEFDKYDKLSNLLSNIDYLILDKITHIIETTEYNKMKEQDEIIFKLKKDEIENKNSIVINYLSELNINYNENSCKKIFIGNGYYLWLS